MEQIIKYIQQKYSPLSIILYANETNNLNSDFDALVISSTHQQYHDTSFVNDIQLDVFVYPISYFAEKYNYEDFIQIFDAYSIYERALSNFNVDNLENWITYIKTHAAQLH